MDNENDGGISVFFFFLSTFHKFLNMRGPSSFTVEAEALVEEFPVRGFC